MVFVVLVSLSAGGTVFAVLDRPFARDPRRHDRVCGVLLTVTAALLVLTAAVTVMTWLAAGTPETD